MSVNRERYGATYFDNPAVVKGPELAARYAGLLLDRIDPGSTVMDVGCAKGGVAAEFARTTTWQTVGVDVSLEALRGAPSGMLRCCASADSLPIETATIDAALLLDVIEHLESPVNALVELRRVVRPGGMLVVTTPNAGSVLRPLLGQRWHGLLDDTHLYFFNSFSLKHLLGKAGWRTCRVFTASGASGVLGRLVGLSRAGGELCVLATTRD